MNNFSRKPIPVSIEGKRFSNIKLACKFFGVSYSAWRGRVYRGEDQVVCLKKLISEKDRKPNSSTENEPAVKNFLYGFTWRKHETE